MSRKTAAKASKEETTKQAKFTHGRLLKRALAWVFDDEMFSHIRLHGNIEWTCLQLVTLTVMWVWSGRKTLGRSFEHARRFSLTIFDAIAIKSYQVLTNALKKWSPQLLPVVQKRLHQLMEQVGGGQYWRVGLWVALAVDGTRVSTPRSASNERAFSAKSKCKRKQKKAQKKAKSQQKRKKAQKKAVTVKPQMWLTLIWHMGLKMPWTWKSGASTSSERQHLLDMLETEAFPENTLFCGDAGFVGYDFWNGIADKGHHFLVRVGGNVRLLTDLGYARGRDGIVCVWPDEAARRGQPPLVLRLIEVKNERGSMFLVTNVLSERKLSNAQVARLYSMRWGIELQFRSFKQTFGRRQLLSRTAECCEVELDWSLVGLWVIQLFAVKEQIAVDLPPERSSVALSLAIIQNTMDRSNEDALNGQVLSQQLAAAVQDQYTRTSSKDARYKPNSSGKPSATRPTLTKATQKHKLRLKSIENCPALFP